MGKRNPKNEHACDLCRSRTKSWEGDDPECAFAYARRFSVQNWNCATMSVLRQIAEESETGDSCDSFAGIVPVPELVSDNFDWHPTHIVLHWYKSRGQTQGAIVFDSNGGIHELSHDLAVATARNYAEQLAKKGSPQ